MGRSVWPPSPRHPYTNNTIIVVIIVIAIITIILIITIIVVIVIELTSMFMLIKYEKDEKVNISHQPNISLFLLVTKD